MQSHSRANASDINDSALYVLACLFKACLITVTVANVAQKKVYIV